MTRTARVALERAHTTTRSTRSGRRPRFAAATLAASVIMAGLAVPSVASATPQATTTVASPALTTAHIGATAPAAATLATAKIAKTKPSVSVKITKKKWTRGTTAGKVTASVKAQGTAAKGKAVFYVGKKKVATKTLKNGKATYRLSSKLSSKKHTVKVVFRPSKAQAKTATSAQRSFRVLVRKSESEKVLAIAKKQVGVKYRSGGTSPRGGFDCSGFTQYVYKKAGVKKLPRTSSAQKSAGKRVSRSKAQPGDLVWSPGHVAIYAGNGKIIDAPRPGKKIAVRKMWQKNAVFIRL
ncbi:C40 family peptidase [Jonesia quinghaiensis]|uniref:C40 family peptidase n=1 Tax=Jonesia quinghaiensis TaxID=262806 RepID=UPI0004138F1E|nr:C40 family peptidase [Jonesia quinghaiensis]